MLARLPRTADVIGDRQAMHRRLRPVVRAYEIANNETYLRAHGQLGPWRVFTYAYE
jgi:hypothetical protein